MRVEGHTQSNGDATLFFHHSLAEDSILVVYVHNILITGSDAAKACHLSAALAQAFEIMAMGLL